MRTKTFDALALLKSQHDEVDALIAKIEASRGEEHLSIKRALTDMLATGVSEPRFEAFLAMHPSRKVPTEIAKPAPLPSLHAR